MAQEKIKHTAEQLKELQSKSLEEKIQISSARIIEWYETWGGQVYVSFSGGKDSTVLLHMVRRLYPDVVGVFSDTGLEFPELRNFVKTFDNIDWIHPEKYDKKTKTYKRYTFANVLKDAGYPVISKEISRDVGVAKNKPNGKTAEKFNPESDYVKKYGQRWCLERYAYLIESPFKISNKCCLLMKKTPLHKYNKETGKHPYIGTMTEESVLRKQTWLNSGCNAFDAKIPQSTPMAFWTEQDVLRYIQKYNLDYAPVYGDLIEAEDGKLHFTGRQRTGCIFCGYGCHLEKAPNRFQQLAETHPKLYNYCINGGEYNEDGIWQPGKGGLGMGKVLDFIGVDYKPIEENDDLDEVTKQAIEEVKKLKK